MKRVFILAFCSALLVCALAVSASAETFSYSDYVTNVKVDGDNDIVTVVIPIKSAEIILYDYNTDKSNKALATNANFPVYMDHSYSLNLTLYYPDSISLTDIPSGTMLTVDADVNLVHGSLDISSAYEDGFFYFYNADMGRVDSYVAKVTSIGYFKWNLELPEYESTYKSFCPGIAYRKFIPNEDTNLSVNINSVTLQFSISSLLRLQQETGRTNVILGEVQKQLEANGQKLDDIMNVTVDPSAPVDSDVVGDIDDAEGQIRDDAQAGIDQGLEVQQSALDIVIQYASGFAVVGWIFNLFADIPFFSGLLYVSFALGIVSAILGLGLSIVNASDARGRRSDAYYSRLGRSSRRSQGGA